MARQNQTKTEAPVWLNPSAALGSAVRYIASLSPRFHWVGIYLLRGKRLELGPYLGEPTSHQRIPVGRGLCGLAIQEQVDLNIPDVSKRPEYLACSPKTRSELIVLVRNKQGKVVGQIDIDSHIENAFGPEEESAVKRVAAELGPFWPRELS